MEEWRERAADVRRERAGLGGAGREEVSESRFEFVRAAAAALSETGASELGGGSGTVICVVGVLTVKTEFGVGVVGDAVFVTDRDGVAGGAVGVVAPSTWGMAALSLSSRSRAPLLLRLREDDGRDANSCAPRRGGG